MTYVGAVPTTGDFKLLDSITTSSTTTFNLRQGGVAVYPQSANHCLVVLNGVLQTAGSSFNIVNDTIVFASSLSSSDVINQILVLGNVNDIGVPSDDTVSTAKIQANAVTSAKIASGVIPTLRPNAKPLIINGDFGMWQRGTTVNNTQDAPYIADRWRNQAVWGSTPPTAAWTISRSTDVPTGQGFVYSTKYDNTTAQSSLTSDTGYSIEQRFEGYQLQWMKKGTSNAEATTLSFWIKSNKTGTYVVELYDVDNSRHRSQSYTISSSGTWEKKVLNFPADTTGAFGNDNGHSMKIRIWLAAGSAYTGGTLATSWASNTANNAAVGQVNLADNTSNELFLTGVQWEVGTFTSSTLPPFQHESYGDNLRRCQRYLYPVVAAGAGGFVVAGYYYASSAIKFGTRLPVVMRAAPSLVQSVGTDGLRFYSNNGYDGLSQNFVLDGGTRPEYVSWYNGTDASGTSGSAGQMYIATTTNYIWFNAEL